MAFFDYDGSPTSFFYPEDNIWFELKESEREEIRLAMKEHRIHLVPTTARPPYNPPQPRPTGRPPYVPHTRPPFRPTVRPPYNPPAPTKRTTTTTTRKPKPGKGDKDFFDEDGGDDDDDDDDEADIWS